MSEPVIWQREAHTKAKHELLRAFFDKWVSVHSESFAKRGDGVVRVYDGFAGPGIYAGGEQGSPLILLDSLLKNPRLQTRWGNVSYDFQFVEKHRGRATALEDQLSMLEGRERRDARWSERVAWTVTCGRYEDHVPRPPTAARTGQQILAFETPLRVTPNTAPLHELLRSSFGNRSFTVEEAQEVTRRSDFLESHLKRLTLARAEAAGQIEVSRPAGARQFKEGKGITMRFF